MNPAPRTVQILGTGPNIIETPNSDAERWCANYHRAYRIRFPEALTTWTRWFNLHTINHIKKRYPAGYRWYTEQSKPIYLQSAQEDISTSLAFPREELQAHFSIDGNPFRFFTCSVAWLMALAIYEGFERIELWGFHLSTTNYKYRFERPCFFYWINRARELGIDVYLPPNIEVTEAGDPATYDGWLYGWEPHTEYYAASF